MKPINIDHLTEAELVDLNHRIVERLKFLNQMRAHTAMMEWRIGDRVTFEPDGVGRLFGIVSRYNKKTVTVITDDGMRWNVSPRLLSMVESEKKSERSVEGKSSKEVIPFRKK